MVIFARFITLRIEQILKSMTIGEPTNILEGQIRQQEAAYNRTVTNLHSQYQQRINQLRNQLRDAQQQLGVMRGMYSRNEQELQKKKRS